jgi:protein-S-isoprenylcysteine O-methyltransferase Ste14
VAVLALVITVAWYAILSGVRAYLHLQRTGILVTPLRGTPFTPQWWAPVLSSIGIGLSFAAPIAELLGLSAITVLDHPVVRWAGVVLALGGIGGAFAAQSAMGDAWRIDVNPAIRGPLVTTGPFRLVRNPIFTCTTVTALGLALMVPSILGLLIPAAFAAAIQVQVRLVEEPYLLRTHGEAYRAYAAHTGRFLPWLGRMDR